MKKIAFFATLVCSVYFQSCSLVQGPDNWNDEIKDSFKYQIVLAQFYLDSDEDIVNAIDSLIEIKADSVYDANNTTDVARYDSVLHIASKEASVLSMFAPMLLNMYNNVNVAFDSFVQQENDGDFSVWISREKNTKIRTTFKINKYLEWSLSLNEKDFEQYLDSLIEFKETQKQILSNIVETIYNSRVKEEDVMSSGFYKTFRNAQLCDNSEIGWPDYDYWRDTNGEDVEMSIRLIEFNEIMSSAIVYLLLDHESSYITKMELHMICESGEWRVDDIVSVNNDKRSSLKEEAAALIEKEKGSL